jgi:hypothetical protein
MKLKLLKAGMAAFVCMILLSACTVLKYSDGEKSLFVADVRLAGSAIDLSGTLVGKGTLDVNREQGSQGAAAAEAIEAATASPLDPIER